MTLSAHDSNTDLAKRLGARGRPGASRESDPARGRRPLPGDPDRRERLERLLRVDLAGEYGARRIYEGQLAILGNTKSGPLIKHMYEQEAKHLAYFEEAVPRHRVRPTILQPAWHVAGYALGAVTAALGEKAAMACTVAVEEVIDGHYARQAEQLADEGEEGELKQAIEQFRQEELEHRDTGLAHGAEETAGYEGLSAVIKAGSRAAIWLSERF